MKNAILFDLGGTLVEYYTRPEFAAILEEALAEVRAFLDARSLLRVSQEAMWQKAQKENYESEDYRVRSLEGRLVRIFQLNGVGHSDDLITGMCRGFLKPIFARGRRYGDTLPTLRGLRDRGFKTAIVTNTPWGTPANLWRDEIERLGLGNLVNTVVCCTDVGWRKPARPIFDLTLEKLQVRPQDCLFVGDNPRWDLVGPRAVGIKAVLINRYGTAQDTGENPIRSLDELWDRL